MAAQEAARATPIVVEVGTSIMKICGRGETSVAAQEAAEASPTAGGGRDVHHKDMQERGDLCGHSGGG
jgi:hypothetical protein